MKVAIINGPNLNLLGTREKEIYGDQSFKDYFLELKTRYDIDLEYFQSNIEGELINRLQELNCDGIVPLVSRLFHLVTFAMGSRGTSRLSFVSLW